MRVRLLDMEQQEIFEKDQDKVVEFKTLKDLIESNYEEMESLSLGNTLGGLKADMKRLQGTNITCYSFRHYYALRCHLKLIDSGSASLSMGHSIEAHHRNYPYSKESTTTNAFKLARERSVA